MAARLETEPGSSRALGSGTGWVLALVALGALTAALVSDPGDFLGDDGGITLRYAKRLAEGAGLSYSGAERVNGASSPLWTLWLAGGLAAGVDAARWVIASGALGWSLAGFFVGCLGARAGGLSIGLLGMAWFYTRPTLQLACFTGLESAMTMTLAGGTLLAIDRGSQRGSALGLGAIVAGKLDGALLAIAYASALLLRERRFPLRVALGAMLVAAPVLATLTWWFGSPIPHSATTKVLLHTRPEGFDRTWMLDRLLTNDPVSLIGALLLGGTLLASRRASQTESTLLGWMGLHLAVYAAVDLGAPFPWYAVAPGYAAVIATTLLSARLTEFSPRLRRIRPALATALGALILVLAGPRLARQLDPMPLDGGLSRTETENLARLLSGAWLSERAAPGECLVSMFGLAAYAFEGPVYDISELNSKGDPQRVITSSYFLAREDMVPGGGYPGLETLGRFQAASEGISYELFARPESRALREGFGYSLLPLAPEPCPEHRSAHQLNGHTLEIPPSGCFLQSVPNASFSLRYRLGEEPAEMENDASETGPGARIHLVHEGNQLLRIDRARLQRGQAPTVQELPLQHARWSARTKFLAEFGYP